MDLISFKKKLYVLIRNKQLNREELWLLSSNYYKTDQDLYNLVQFFSNDSCQKPILHIMINKKDLSLVKQSATSLYRKILKGDIDE